MCFSKRLVRTDDECDPLEEVLTVRSQMIPHPCRHIVRLSDIAKQLPRTVRVRTDLYIDPRPARLRPPQQLANPAAGTCEDFSVPIADIGNDQPMGGSVGQKQPYRSPRR